jgi:hypothetical protein
MNKQKKKNLFERKGVTIGFGIASLVSGILFLNSTPTGNIILSEQNPVSYPSLIGLMLLLCSAILITYSLKKR